MTNVILAQNWNYTFYKNEDLKAFVSIAHDFNENNEMKEYYFASVIDGENNDLFQKKHSDLDAACHYLNSKYHGTWEFTSLEKPASSGGCDTCVAH